MTAMPHWKSCWPPADGAVRYGLLPSSSEFDTPATGGGPMGWFHSPSYDVNTSRANRAGLPGAVAADALEPRLFLAAQAAVAPLADPPGAFPAEHLVADINPSTHSARPRGTVVTPDGAAWFFA